MKFQAPRGTEDVLPQQAAAWRHVESTFRQIAWEYGYGELRTPTFEDTQLFLRTSGDTSDIVSKEMYSFEDKGQRNVTLKPELTAPAIRAIIEHSLCPTGTIFRGYYIGPIFRYGRPQSGRLREAHQVGVELVGAASADADAEVIELTYRFLQRLGIDPNPVALNNIGRVEARTKYREVVLAHVSSWLADQTPEMRAAAEKNPLRLLDTKDADLRAVLDGLPPITDYLEESSRARLDALVDLLQRSGVPIRIDPAIVRGLDYYTETVFEIVAKHIPNGASLCGGGRYDNLVKELGGADAPSVGVGIGIERILIEMAGNGVEIHEAPPLAFAVSADAAGTPWIRDLVASLRSHHVAVQWDVEQRSMKSQLRQADRSGAKFSLIAGEAEVSRGMVQVKDMHTGESAEVPRSEVEAWLLARR